MLFNVASNALFMLFESSNLLKVQPAPSCNISQLFSKVLRVAVLFTRDQTVKRV